MSAVATIEEAQRLARKVIEAEKGRCGGHVPSAIHRAASLYGVEATSLQVLWERRARKFVKAHVLDRLREIDLWLEERAKRERHILAETAAALERCHSPAARIARRAAEMAGAPEKEPADH